MIARFTGRALYGSPTLIVEGMTQEQLDNSMSQAYEMGCQGEEFVLEYERKRLPESLSSKVIHLRESEIARGYDILSFEGYDSILPDRYIEVKTFRGHPHFYWTENEIAAARKYKEHYYLYLVDIDCINDAGYEPQIIPNPAILFDDENLWSHQVMQYAFSLNADENIPADWGSSVVLLGCYNNKAHLQWILDHNLYNVLAQRNSPGSVTLNNSNVKKAVYLILYSISNPRVYTLHSLIRHPRLVSKSEMLTLGYPTPRSFRYILHPIKERIDTFHINLTPLLREVNHRDRNTYGTPLYLTGALLREYMHLTLGVKKPANYKPLSTILNEVAEPSSAFQLWTPELEAELVRMFDAHVRFEDIATQMHRSKRAILMRLRKLGKIISK